MIKEVTIGTKSLEQMLAECPRPSSGDPGHTLLELAAAIGMSDRTVRTRLRILHAAGQVITGRAVRPTLSGGRTTVPVYRLKAPAKRK